MTSKIQIRRGTAASWTSTNAILSEGELGYELDTGKLKIGNGNDEWIDLDYFADVAGFTGNYEDLIGAPTNLSEFVNDSEFITLADVPAIPTDISDLDDSQNLLSGGTTLTITSTQVSTASIPTDTIDNVDLDGGRAYILYKIETSDAAWVRVYTSDAARTADAARTQGQDPGLTSGVIAEAITTGAEVVTFSPAPNGFNDDFPVTGTIALAVTNLSGSTAVIDVTITKLTLVA